MFCAILVTVMVAILECQVAKKSSTKLDQYLSMVLEIWSFSVYAISLTTPGGNLDRCFFHIYFKKLKTRIILTYLVKIHFADIEIMLFSCSALFLVIGNGCILGMPNCNKSKQLYITFSLNKNR